jgi:hypothetical protein
MWFLAPPRLHPLAILAGPLIDIARDRGRAHEADRLDLGAVEEGVDGHLVALHDVEDTGGRAGLLPQLAIQIAAEGSFSLGLSTTVLPAAIAIGKNHIGTIAGKLNGLMMPTTPKAWRFECTSTRWRRLRNSRP